MLGFIRISIGRKLAVAVGALLVVVVGTLSILAFVEVRRANRLAAFDRLGTIGRQAVEQSEASYAGTRADLRRRAMSPEVAAFLRSQTAANRTAVVPLLTYPATSARTLRVVELWNGQRERLLQIGDDAGRFDTAFTRGILEADVSADSVVMGRLAILGDSVKNATWTPLGGDGRDGFLVVWRVLISTVESRRSFLRLVGEDAAIFAGNDDGSLWTDLGSPVPGPEIDLASLGALQTYRRDGEGRLAAATKVRTSPLLIVVEVPSKAVDAPAMVFLRRVLAIVVLLLLIALIGLQVISRRMTTPLVALTDAVGAMSRGEAVPPVAARGTDEVGRLALAFNDMQRRVREAHSTLEHRVLERTEELTEAREAADRANRAKSEFLTKMSHELRTPLNSIIGFSEVMLDHPEERLSERQGRFVGNVLKSGRQLLELINGILDLSKVEAGRMTLHAVEFDLPTLLTDVHEVVESLAAKQELRLDLQMAPDLGVVSADPVKVKQILLNLLSNAIKFTHPGGTVTLAARVLPPVRHDGQRVLEMRVIDTGIGISSEDQARVFVEFEQVASDYTRGLQGTGLGLALTRRLVELHGGAVTLESVPGKGSTFTVTLPLAAARPTVTA